MSKLLGPLFYWDLIRQARKGHASWLRSLYALALLIGLFYVYDHFFPQHSLAMMWENPSVFDVNELARLAEGFASMILALQFLAVLVLTPPYVASAIPAEREGGTLPLLFTTHLGDREIVLGKAVSRVVHLFGLLLTGLPILALTQWFGGVDMGWLIGNYVRTALTMCSIASLCMAVGSMSQTVLGAVLGSYALVLTLGTTCAFLLMKIHQEVSNDFNDFLALGFDFLVHGGSSVLLLHLAVWELRYRDLSMALFAEPAGAGDQTPMAETATIEVRSAELDPVEAQTVRTAYRPARIGKHFYKLDDWPLLWKEMYHDPRTIFLILFFVFTPSLVLVIVPNLEPGNYYQAQRLKLLLEVGFLLLAYLFFGCVAFRAADSIVKERVRHTLAGLLMLPGGQADMLKAKWLGSILRYWLAPVFVGGVLFWGLIYADLDPFAILVLLVLFAVQTAFLASLGLWLSVWAGSRFVALTAMAFILFLLLAVCPMLESFQSPMASMALRVFNYPRLWWTLLTLQAGSRPDDINAVVLSLIFFGLAASLLWLSTRWHLTVALERRG